MKIKKIEEKYNRIVIHLNEKSRRLWCANEAISVGWGGISLVSEATGFSRTTITEGIKEITGKKSSSSKKIRKKGGGRRKTVDKDKKLPEDLDILIEPFTRGDPESPLRWVCKSTGKLSGELKKQGHDVSHSLVARTLKELDYSLQSNKKTKSGSQEHPDRNAQFHFIN